MEKSPNKIDRRFSRRLLFLLFCKHVSPVAGQSCASAQVITYIEEVRGGDQPH